MKKTSSHNNAVLTILVASVIGLLVSAYLTYVKLFQTPIYCTPGLGDCETVNSSGWSTVFGVPIALLGFLSYLALLLLTLFRTKGRFLKQYAKTLIFGIGLFGFLYSLYLTGLEFFVIKAFCQWCVISALCMTAIFVASIFLMKQKRIITTHRRNT